MYAELHCHSAFSFLDGASRPAELVAAAARLGHDVLALTDHNSVSGSMELAVAMEGTGLRAIHGAEVDVVVPGVGPGGEAASRHLTLLVEREAGWRNLCRILTRAHLHTRVAVGDEAPSRGAMRRTGPPPSVSLETVQAHAEGLVCLTGCADHGCHDEPTARRLLAAFGGDGLRVELQRPFARHDRARNARLAELADRLGVPTVATGNVHAHTRSRAPLQDAFVALRHHGTLDATEPVRRGNTAHVLASPAAMAARFADHPRAVAETRELAERLVGFDLRQDLGYRYPGAEDPRADAHLAELCHARMDERYPPRGNAELRVSAQARLVEELRVIAHLRLAGFFLLHHEVLELAREVAIEVRGPSLARAVLPPGRGRGSSVSSIVCYLAGLSHIDPIANELLLGRFLNEDLQAFPDIDLDFPRDIRAELIPRIHDRYGAERSALVAAFPTFRTRGAIRELGKVLGLPPGEIERVARAAEPFGSGDPGRDVEVGLAEHRRAPSGGSRDTPAQPASRWEWLVALSREAYRLPRHLSQHSGGMIISTRPLVDCCPVIPAAMEGRRLCQWDKDSCSDAGFLKMDLLGLGMLSAVERCVESIAHTRGERVDLSRIPFDDPATFKAIREADTLGVFQIESRAQMASLRRTQPETLDDLTVQVAIVRPGPIVGGAVNPYIAHRQRLREDPDFQVPYLHPALEPVLKDTLGTIIFQDQVLEVAVAFAGFTTGQAEGLRRAMSRKRSAEALEKHHADFVSGAGRVSGASPDVAERVWEMVCGFSGFGFPKAHGAAFGLLAYQSTWLRVHYKPELLCALLNEQPMGFYPADALAHEAQRNEGDGVRMLGPDVNASDVECTVDAAGGVRIGLGYITGVRRDEVTALVAEREASGLFASTGELVSRAGAGRPSLEHLAWSGACDGLAGGRRQALWQLGAATPGVRLAGVGTQLALPLTAPDAPPLDDLHPWEAMVADYATTGLTLGAHPMALLRPHLQRAGVGTRGSRVLATSRDLETLAHDTWIAIGGLVVARQRPGTANGIVFMLLEDEVGTINLVVSPELYERRRIVVRAEPLVLAEGRLERTPAAAGAINVRVTELRALEAPATARAEVVDLVERARQARPPVAVDEADQAGLDDFRGVAPPVQSFAQGRRR